MTLCVGLIKYEEYFEHTTTAQPLGYDMRYSMYNDKLTADKFSLPCIALTLTEN